MDNELLKVLEAREQRWEMRKRLVEERNSCLITITLCAPVSIRTSEESWVIFQKLCSAFWEILISSGNEADIEGYLRNDDGPAYFISTQSRAEDIKKVCVEAEETIPGGRLLDIDVMDRGGAAIGRSDIGLPPRKCFVCDNPAAICVSRKQHSSSDIYEYVQQLKAEIISSFGLEGKFKSGI